MLRFSLTVTAVIHLVLLACVLSFNVDQKTGVSFSGPLEDMFGYTVQQFENSEGKWVLIGSPLSGQPATRTGDVYKCPVGRDGNKCVKLDLPKNTTIPKLREVKENMTMGTTLVTNPRGGFLACGPQYGYMCGQQQYISGVCANVSSSFQILNSVAPAVQGTQAASQRRRHSLQEVTASPNWIRDYRLPIKAEPPKTLQFISSSLIEQAD